MGVVAELLKEIPAAAAYEAALKAMEQEIERLREENAQLKEELGQFIQQWETLDNDAVRTLEYLSQFERGHAQDIAQACRINVQCIESQLKFLAAWNYVHAPANGADAGFALAHKGRRYLRERGLLRDTMYELISGE